MKQCQFCSQKDLTHRYLFLKLYHRRGIPNISLVFLKFWGRLLWYVSESIGIRYGYNNNTLLILKYLGFIVHCSYWGFTQTNKISLSFTITELHCPSTPPHSRPTVMKIFCVWINFYENILTELYNVIFSIIFHTWLLILTLRYSLFLFCLHVQCLCD